MRAVTTRSFLLALAALASLGSTVAEAPTREYQVKAAFVYNFTQFVEWPAASFAAPDAPLVVGVAGANDPFDGALEHAMAGKTAGNRPILVRRFATADQLQACHLIFLPASCEDWLPKVAQAQGGKPCLTVGESDEVMEKGGMVGFFTEDGKLRFEVDQKAVENAGLKVSSKLLKLAKIYKK